MPNTEKSYLCLSKCAYYPNFIIAKSYNVLIKLSYWLDKTK